MIDDLEFGHVRYGRPCLHQGGCDDEPALDVAVVGAVVLGAAADDEPGLGLLGDVPPRPAGDGVGGCGTGRCEGVAAERYFIQ